MNYIIFDLEATCWPREDAATQDHPNEIIEIGAVKLDAEYRRVGEFARFVRPRLHPVLSDFCRELTTITQTDMDGAEDFPTVLADFRTWISDNDTVPYRLCSWGFYDRKQLRQDCDLHGLDRRWLKHHISVKHQYARLNALERPIGMGMALEREGLTLEGTHHRGIDDARNIARIFGRYAGRWKAPK